MLFWQTSSLQMLRVLITSERRRARGFKEEFTRFNSNGKQARDGKLVYFFRRTSKLIRTYTTTQRRRFCVRGLFSLIIVQTEARIHLWILHQVTGLKSMYARTTANAHRAPLYLQWENTYLVHYKHSMPVHTKTNVEREDELRDFFFYTTHYKKPRQPIRFALLVTCTQPMW